MSTSAVERSPAPAAPAAEPAPGDTAPRSSPAPEGPPAVRLLDASPAPPANVPGEVGAVLRSPGPGEPLPAAVAAPIGTSLGVDVSPVRVHADAPAAGAAEAVSARAFTYGTHVYLGPGERSTDLPLVSHEVAHVVQQQGSPAVQLFGGGPDPGPLEHEAQRASAAVTRGETAVVVGRTTPAVQRQFGWLRRAAGAVAGAVTTVAGAVAGGISGLLDRAINFVKERARSIPGYDLVAFALGRDPITQQPVERNALNLIRAVISLIPGGAALFQTLQQSGAIQRAFEWATSELARLGLTWTNIRTAVSRFLDSLGPSDLLNLGGVFERARAMFGPLLSAAVRFAAAAGRKLLEFVFEAVMASAGGQRIVSIFRRIGETFSLIVSDPIRFLGNLLNAIKGGFQRFAANIIGHLRTALFEWLLGALRGALTLPSRWDFAGIMSVILQILGLTWQALRGRLVRLIGERAVGYLETAFEFIQTIVTRGVSAAWERILEFATGLIDTVIEGIRNWVARSIVGAAVTRLVTMFNPVGAIIQSIIAIYNTVMFFVERAQQIAALVDSIVDSIANIASGNVGAAVSYVERTMARFLPVLISFLARLIGLGNISGTIREIIGRIRGVVDRAIDRVIDWVVARVRGLIARLTGPRQQEGPQDAREQTRRILLPRLAAGKTREELQPILTQTLPEVRPLGVQALTLGPDDPQTGRAQVFIEINPRVPFIDLFSLAEGRAMRSQARITLEPQIRAADLPMAQVAESRVLGPPAAPGQPRAMVPGIGLFRPEHGEVSGTGLVPRGTGNVIETLSWNTGAKSKADAGSHAETHFYHSIRSQTWLDKIVEISITNYNFNPCGTCARNLVALLQTVNRARAGAGKPPARFILRWSGADPWVNEAPGIALTPERLLAMIQEAIGLMAGAGWDIDPRAPNARGLAKIRKAYTPR